MTSMTSAKKCSSMPACKAVCSSYFDAVVSWYHMSLKTKTKAANSSFGRFCFLFSVSVEAMDYVTPMDFHQP